MDRYFTNLTLKTIDEDQRIVEGIATTPSRDLAGDEVLPEGAEYELPIPFMVDHDHAQNVGSVEMAEVTPKGIRFRARVRKITEPGKAKDLCDYAWSLLRNGLRPGCSIGFKPLETSPLPDGGWLIRTWRWLELSAVSVACQPEARVTALKGVPRRRGAATQVRLSSPKPATAATRRKRSGKVIIDERKHVRRARAALVRTLGEKNVPHFPSLAALERWDDERRRKATATGALWLGYEALMAAAPRRKPLPVVRLWGR